MTADDALVVIGAGHAGVELAVQTRESGWSGSIVLVGDEAALPYQRPPLSKAYLAGEAPLDSLALRARTTYEKAGVELLLGRRVQSIDRAASQVSFHDGSRLGYTRLALATGGRPRRLPAAADGAEQADNFHYLRALGDVDFIRKWFERGTRLVIVGGGYIGLEVAAVAIKAGLKVVVLEAASRVLARVTEPRVSSFYEQVHRAAGVDLRTGVEVDGFTLDASRRRVTEVHCNDGERVPADLVIAGIGLVPNTELAAEARLAVDDGILVDAFARTSDPAVVAAGDCTRFESSLYGRTIRLESVPNALEQARAAAASACGIERRHDSVPWFWSDQYDLKLKMAGLSQGHDRFVLRGSIEGRSFAAFYLKGDRVLAVDTVNRIPEFMLAKRLVAERIVVDAERLADDSVPLKTLLSLHREGPDMSRRQADMPSLTIIEFNGTEHRIDADVGKSAMQAAIDAMVPGIMADCGGACSCATCHCYVDEAWLTCLPEPTAAEREMLECALDPQDNSRLSCQIRITPHTEGLVLRLPKAQV